MPLIELLCSGQFATHVLWGFVYWWGALRVSSLRLPGLTFIMWHALHAGCWLHLSLLAVCMDAGSSVAGGPPLPVYARASSAGTQTGPIFSILVVKRARGYVSLRLGGILYLYLGAPPLPGIPSPKNSRKRAFFDPPKNTPFLAFFGPFLEPCKNGIKSYGS